MGPSAIHMWCSLTLLSPISSSLAVIEGGEFSFCSFRFLLCVC